MSLVTRCPRCMTLFRVTPVQLQGHAGQVRCGRCMHVFDGFESLAVEQANSISEPVRFEPEEGSTESAPAETPAPSSETTDATTVPAAERVEASQIVPAREAIPAPPPSRLGGLFSRSAERVHGRRRRSQNMPLVLGIVVLALVLGAQFAYAFRQDLAGRFPAVRSAMESLCGVAGCSVSLPQRPDLIRIEASDVHMIDVNRPALIQVTATLRSYADYDLAYPALDLVLTNANEHALARRVFLPGDYVGRGRDPKSGVPPNAEITVALDLDTGDLNAAGFRLDLLAAPRP